MTSSLQQHIAEFIEWKQINRGRSPRTAQVYGLALSRLGQFLGEQDHLSATHDQLVIFTGKWLYDRGLRDPLSRKTHVSAVREFYKWLASRGLVRGNPAEHVAHARIGRRLPRVMTLTHAEQLMWAPDYSTFEGVRDAAMIALLMGCGLRVSGLVGLNESNVQPAVVDGEQRLTLRTVEKGGKERQVPIPTQADLLLRLYMQHPGLADIDRTLPSGDKVLFVSTRNTSVPAHEYIGEARRLRRKGVLRMIQTYGRRIGLPPEVSHPHALRHMFGTELAEDDVPTVTAANLMGHSDPKNTAIYQHLAMRKLTRTLDKANPLAKMKTPVSDLLNAINKR
ncbi:MULTISPECIES: tyrosine-type recombinase/integrase [Pseudomonadota]|uniref:tyrosine-type recombinase/integrase n=1 Tax=Pseudomonadota TaxID=1224 RepID=UPI0023F43C2B|nr:tyrosine-type recombinase/integrase [Thauera propionica]MCK9540198.1 tyrosine-type recombinase/integrase [Dokdonella sp.]MDD3677275.1 tyrosine-type recombinase/integrase [Thauera propionica]